MAESFIKFHQWKGLSKGDIKADKSKISGNAKVTGNVHHSELLGFQKVTNYI